MKIPDKTEKIEICRHIEKNTTQELVILEDV